MDKYNDTVYADWWNRFDNRIRRDIPWTQAISEALAQYNGRDVKDSFYIEFDTEEDYLMFRIMTDSYATIATQ
jgi:hypothetical protein